MNAFTASAVASGASVVGRLAPSPSGPLHLGHARTFVLAWCSARARGGQMRLRLEDLDTGRCRPEYADLARRDLEWLGLSWDGAELLQSSRLPVLRERLAELEPRGLVFPCVCTRAELRRAQSAPHGSAGERPYPGTCAGRFGSVAHAREQTGREPALRFVAPPEPVQFIDRLHGPQSQRVDRVAGDFVVGTRDGGVAYQLAVVLDDAAQGVTEVVRGDDLLASTPRQLLVARAFGVEPPEYAHVPLVTDRSGQRLAKRTQALALSALRDAGVDPRGVIGWVARSARLARPERLSAAELARGFDLTAISRRPVALGDEEWRGWLR